MEEWRAVPGWAGIYEVSDSGRARSVDREFVNARGRHCRLRGIELAATPGVRGYPRVGLSRPGARLKHVEVHVLVALAFLGPCPPGQEVRHANGDRTDARLCNLSYGTRAENQADSVQHGTRRGAAVWQRSKETCPLGHRLAAPNLCNGTYRKCLACMRANATCIRLRRAGKPADKRAEADRHYLKITAELDLLAQAW